MNAEYTFLSQELGREILNRIFGLLTEAREKPIAIYPGRFQPFHKGHYSIYLELVKRYGKDRVFIATSDTTDLQKSPFSFDEKRSIISTLFNIPIDKIVRVKNVYAPIEITSKFPQSTPVISAVGEKDAGRLRKNSKYYRPLIDNPTMGYKQAGYMYIAPDFKLSVGGQNISGTQIRKLLGDPSIEVNTKKKIFELLYGQFNQKMFDLIQGKLQQLQTTNPLTKKSINKVLGQKIKNPKTNRNILVKSALKYDVSEPVYKAAKQLIMQRENVLLEGGAAGHLLHPYEDYTLTFKEIKDMIIDGITGKLDKKYSISEKTDGQNLMFTVKNGMVRFARNKSHIKNFGEAALSIEQLKQMFSGRDLLEKSFGRAAEDLQAAIQQLSPQQISNMFNNGKKFMNLEIIHPSTKNVIPYNNAIIQLHGTVEFDKDANVVNRNSDDGKILSDQIREVGADKQKEYGIRGPNIISFNDAEIEDDNKKVNQLLTKLSDLQKKYNLTDSDQYNEYLRKWWNNTLLNIISSKSLSVPDIDRKKLVEKFLGHSLNKSGLSDDSKKLLTLINSNYKRLKSISIKPIELLFLEAGSIAVSKALNILAANNPHAAKEIQKQVIKTINKIKQSKDPDKIEKLRSELLRLQSAGGIKNIKPIEGVVFIHNGKPYKLTGSFAPVNQILGIRGFEDKRSVPSTTGSDKSKELVKKKHSKNMSSILNKRVLNPKTKRNILVKTAIKYDKKHPAYIAARRLLHLD